MNTVVKPPGSRESNVRQLSEARAKRDREKTKRDLQEVKNILIPELKRPRNDSGGRPIRLHALETAAGMWKAKSLDLERLESQDKNDFEKLSLILLEKYLLSGSTGNVKAAEGFVRLVGIKGALKRMIEAQLFERDSMVGAIQLYSAAQHLAPKDEIKGVIFKYLIETKARAQKKAIYTESHMREVEDYLLGNFKLSRTEYEKYSKRHRQESLQL